MGISKINHNLDQPSLILLYKILLMGLSTDYSWKHQKF